MPHKIRKSQLIDFDDAAAGHKGVLSDKSGTIIVKPCKQAEINFYDAAEAHAELLYYMPRYMGSLRLGPAAVSDTIAAAVATDPDASTTTGPIVLDEPAAREVINVPAAEGEGGWKPSGGAAIAADVGIVMENVAYGFTKPNIVDVKMGARLWADDAPLEKREKLDKAAAETTSGPLGYRIAGMKIYVGGEKENGSPTTATTASNAEVQQDAKGYKRYEKDYGRQFGVKDVHRGFEEFFFNESVGVSERLGRRIVKRFLLDLRGLLEVLEKEESRMYSASLLFVYEGDGKKLAENFTTESEMLKAMGSVDEAANAAETANTSVTASTIAAAADATSAAVAGEKAEDADEASDDSDADSNPASKLPKIQALKMIDFAHAQFVPGEGPDENVLRGMRNLISTLEGLVD